MFSRILMSTFALLFATSLIISTPISSVAEEQQENAAQEAPAQGEEQQASDQAQEADETLKPEEAAGDEEEAPKY
ncbi:MAG: hypothetical protein ACR2NW_02020 [Thermodesulfobacteriota bacterium]